jgi:hypothetical protein
METSISLVLYIADNLHGNNPVRRTGKYFIRKLIENREKS